MKFRLVYQGPLKSNGRPPDKQDIRRYLHPQLKTLWNQYPLDDWVQRYNVFNPTPPNASSFSLVHSVSGFEFVPIVSDKVNTATELDILMLRPDMPGKGPVQSGDIDNRIKTLLDALRIPKTPNELPTGDTPQTDEKPFFCVLDDDSLITKISIETDQLLDPPQRDHVHLVIYFNVFKTKQTIGNINI